MLAAFSLFSFQTVFAGASHNVSGWAWSENTAFISFNSSNCDEDNNGIWDGVSGCPSAAVPFADYGVDINETTGVISGYAWSEHLGWISFESQDVANCPTPDPISGCQATVDMTCAGGKCVVSGWARVVSTCKDDLWDGTHCTGPGAGNTAGGWSGWIHLKGNTYETYIDPSTGDFYGWGYSDMVLGWMSFNNNNTGGPKDYKVNTDAPFDPNPIMTCWDCQNQKNGADGCTSDPWLVYQYSAICPNCSFSVVNDSTGNINCTYWEISGASGSASFKGTGVAGERINLSVFGNVAPGDYNLKMTVSNVDSGNCQIGKSKSISRPVTIKKEIIADFQCSLDDPATSTFSGWKNCTSAADKDSFEKKIVIGSPVYLKDISSPSADATLNKHWDFDIKNPDSNFEQTDEITSFVAGKTNKISLVVEDSANHNCTRAITFGARTLPQWLEIGYIMEHIFSSLSKIVAEVQNLR